MYRKFGLYINGGWRSLEGGKSVEVLSPFTEKPIGAVPAAYAFTRSPDRARRTLAALKSGMAGINSFALAASEPPFGGTSYSGMGREGGSEGIYVGRADLTLGTQNGRLPLTAKSQR